jgi:NADH-quinone oxidoreductase subunit K
MTIGPGQYAALSGIVFAIGLFGVLSRRDAFGVLAGLGLLLLAPVVALVGFAETGGGAGSPPQGEIVALVVIVVCVSQGLVGAGLVALLRRRQESLEVDDYNELEA